MFLCPTPSTRCVVVGGSEDLGGVSGIFPPYAATSPAAVVAATALLQFVLTCSVECV